MLESTYQVALAHELRLVGLKAESEVLVGIRYKDLNIPNAFRIDLMVEGLVVLEIKAVEKLLATHEAQLLTYLRCCGKRLGLVLNFNEATIKRGIRRVVNQL